MDQIDVNLIDAWRRICERARRDATFAAERSKLARRAIVTRPMRASCLCVRAADTRIDDVHFALVSRRAYASGDAHEVDLHGEGVRDVCKPVSIRYPGVRIKNFASRFGIAEAQVWRWMKKGEINVRYEKAGAHVGYFGKDVPWVWTRGPVDPNRMKGMEIEEIWGSLWQGLWRRVPTAFHQTVMRVPRMRPRRYKDGVTREQFRGWDWMCPGVLDERGKVKSCGRQVQRLYAAVPVYRVQDFLGEVSPVALPDLHEAVGSIGHEGERLRFACNQCVNWMHVQGTNPSYAWNMFVRQMSGGLLFGSEVERPDDFAGFKRKKAAARSEHQACQPNASADRDDATGDGMVEELEPSWPGVDRDVA